MSVGLLFGTMTLGDLIEALESCRNSEHPDFHVFFDFGGFVPTDCSSYRGFYDHLALGYREPTYPGIALETLIEHLKTCVGAFFTGWKGGSYQMALNTPVWAANPGEAPSTAIVSVTDNGYFGIINTSWVDV